MSYNAKADIHQFTWYRSDKGRVFLCTSAGWCDTPETPGVYTPQNIQLMEYLTCEPKHISTEKMIQMLNSGMLKVIKSPL